jgi:hypothetical protein
MRCKLTRGNGAPLILADGVAPAFNMAPCLFNKVELKGGGGTIGTPITEFLPQIDSFKKRSRASKAWRETIGYGTQWLQSSFRERQRQVASDGDGFFSFGETSTPRSGPNSLGYDAPGATSNSLEIVAGANGIDGEAKFAVGDDGNALPEGVWSPGDLLQLTNNADNYEYGDRYEVKSVAGQTLQIRAVGNTLVVLRAASGNVTFQRVRKNDPTRIGAYGALGRAREVGSFEVIWQPPLSAFDLETALPSGDYELRLNPQNAGTYQNVAVETLDGRVAGVGAGNIKFEIEDMYLYVAVAEGVPSDNLSYILDLEEIQVQSDAIAAQTGVQQKNFDVSPSTFALALAFQDNATLNDTKYSPSKFRVQGDPTDPYGEESRLIRFFLNYATINKPQPDAEPLIGADAGGKIDYSIQRYLETQIHNGAFNDVGGGEALQEWQDNGSYYYFNWPKDGNDVSTRVQSSTSFSPALSTSALVLLFYKFKMLTRVSVVNGRITSIRSEQA